MESTDYNKKAVYELKAICLVRSLSRTGNKDELIKRLIASDKSMEPVASATVFDNNTDPDGIQEKKEIAAKYRKSLESVRTERNAEIDTLDRRLKQAKADLEAAEAKLKQEKMAQDKAVDDRVSRHRENIKATSKNTDGAKRSEHAKGGRMAESLLPVVMGSGSFRSDVEHPGADKDEPDGMPVGIDRGSSSKSNAPKQASAAEVLRSLHPESKRKSEVASTKPVQTKKVKVSDKSAPSANDKKSVTDARPELIEPTPIEPTLGNIPYLLIIPENSTVRGDVIEVLMAKFARYSPLRVRADKTAFFMFFDNTEKGDHEMAACFKVNTDGFWALDTKMKVRLVGRGIDSDSDSDEDADADVDADEDLDSSTG